MSNITTIYNAFKLELTTLFPNKTLIPNPYSINDNNDNLLKDGYGLRYGPAGLPSFDLPTFQGYSREIIVPFTKQIYRTDGNLSSFEVAQLAMLEDQNTLINSLAKNRTFDDSVVSVEFTSDSGIEFIFDGKFNFLLMETSFEIQ